MINNKRLAKIKKELEKSKGKLIVITFEDGSELKVTANTIHDSFVRHDEETEFIKAIMGKEIVSCSELEILVSIIQQLAEHGPYAEKLAEGYRKNSERPFEIFTNEELKKIIDYCESDK